MKQIKPLLVATVTLAMAASATAAEAPDDLAFESACFLANGAPAATPDNEGCVSPEDEELYSFLRNELIVEALSNSGKLCSDVNGSSTVWMEKVGPARWLLSHDCEDDLGNNASTIIAGYDKAITIWGDVNTISFVSGSDYQVTTCREEGCVTE